MTGALTAGKKIKGRKRHIAVDCMGNLLWVVVHAANIHDTKSGLFPAMGACSVFPSIQKLYADAGYRGTFVAEAADNLGIEVDIVSRNGSKSWEILPKRWIVERTFAWLNNSRRLSKDYEKTTDSAEAMTRISHIHTLMKRL